MLNEDQIKKYEQTDLDTLKINLAKDVYGHNKKKIIKEIIKQKEKEEQSNQIRISNEIANQHLENSNKSMNWARWGVAVAIVTLFVAILTYILLHTHAKIV